jgi:hypothetical protein
MVQVFPRVSPMSGQSLRKTDLPELTASTSVPTSSSPRSTISSVLVFATHQVVATIGILVLVNLATTAVADSLQYLLPRFSIRYAYWILTETPFYPLQIAAGLLNGYLVGRRWRHREMLWVWILPTLLLCLAFAALRDIRALPLAARISHFFGWGCRPAVGCLDQLEFTLPFYSALCYSSGALLARRLRPTHVLAQRT